VVFCPDVQGGAIVKSPLLNKAAAPQFPAISYDEAKQWLISQGFTEGQQNKRGLTELRKDHHVVQMNEKGWHYRNEKSRFGDDGKRFRDLIAKVKNVLRTKKKPEAPQVTIPDFPVLFQNKGVYYDTSVGTLKDNPDKLGRFTAYFYCDKDDPEMASEEVDIDARDVTHAKAIAEAAWNRDYDSPYFKLKFRQQHGLYM
jgi:hypothetical protein